MNTPQTPQHPFARIMKIVWAGITGASCLGLIVIFVWMFFSSAPEKFLAEFVAVFMLKLIATAVLGAITTYALSKK